PLRRPRRCANRTARWPRPLVDVPGPCPQCRRAGRVSRKSRVAKTAPGEDLNGVSGMANQAADYIPLWRRRAVAWRRCSWRSLRSVQQTFRSSTYLRYGPDPLVRVQVGGVARQLLEAQSRGCTLSQERLDGLGAMDRRTVPDHQQLASDVSQQM